LAASSFLIISKSLSANVMGLMMKIFCWVSIEKAIRKHLKSLFVLTCFVYFLTSDIPASEYSVGNNVEEANTKSIRVASTLDPYLKILSYKVEKGLIKDPENTYVRVLVKAKMEDQIFENLPAIVRIGNIFTSYCRLSDLSKISSYNGIIRVEIGSTLMSEQYQFTTPNKCISQFNDQQFASGILAGNGVIIGIIDTGLAIGNADFFDIESRECRIIKVWDQFDQSGLSPFFGGQSYGTEYDQPAIFQSIRHDDTITKDSKLHGTGIASTCAGQWGIAPMADLIFVKFTGDAASAVEATYYIMTNARELGKPCVINLSYATDSAGRHKGGSLLEEALQNMTGKGRIIVCSAGNRDKYTCFAGYSNSGEVTIPLEIKSGRGNQSTDVILPSPILSIAGNLSHIEIWKDSFSEKAISVDKGETGKLAFSESTELYFSWESKNRNEEDEYLVLQWIYHDQPENDEEWWLRASTSLVDRDHNAKCLIRAWAVGKGKYSQLKFKSLGNTDPIGVFVPATAQSILSVGSCNNKGRLSYFSPLPYLAEKIYKPDFYVPGESIIVSVPSVQVKSDKRPTMTCTGTSISAAQLTGYIALLLEYRSDLDPAMIRKILLKLSKKGSTSKREFNNTPENLIRFIDSDIFFKDRSVLEEILKRTVSYKGN